MEITNAWDWVVQQGPTVALALIVIYFGYKHFSTQLSERDAAIVKKDDEIKQLNRDYREDLQKSFNSLQDVNSAINESLQKWIMKDEQNFDMKNDIKSSLQTIEATCTNIAEKLGK